jgi:hypothetical protein
VSREVSRHGGRPLYRANEADQQAWESALRPKACLLAIHKKLRRIVASKLILEWSPEQISGWLKTQFPREDSLRVSHETIYRSLFIQTRGVLKKERIQHLRSKRRIRRSRHSRVGGQSRGQIVDSRSIRERPAEIADRDIPGRREGDLLAGTRNSHIGTLVERHSRFTGKGAQQGHGCCRRRAEPASAQTPGIATAIVDAGPRTAAENHTANRWQSYGHRCARSSSSPPRWSAASTDGHLQRGCLGKQVIEDPVGKNSRLHGCRPRLRNDLHPSVQIHPSGGMVPSRWIRPLPSFTQ